MPSSRGLAPTWWQALSPHHLLHAMLQPMRSSAHMPQTKHLHAVVLILPLLHLHCYSTWVTATVPSTPLSMLCRSGGHAEQAFWGGALGPVPAGHGPARVCLRGPLGAGRALHAARAGLHRWLRCRPAGRCGPDVFCSTATAMQATLCSCQTRTGLHTQTLLLCALYCSTDRSVGRRTAV